MVFRHYGFEVDQARIVRETFGRVVDAPGSAEDMLRALSRTWTDDRGRRFRVMADLGSATADTAVVDLDRDRPLIVGTYGHAMVLTALSYQPSGWGMQITNAMVRDPWPGRGRRALSEEEWLGADLLVRIVVQPITEDYE